MLFDNLCYILMMSKNWCCHLFILALLCIPRPAQARLEAGCDFLFLAKAAEQVGVLNFGHSADAFVELRMKQLANFDEQAWLEVFDYFIANGDPRGTLNYDLLPLLVSLPMSLQQKLDVKMREAYPSATKDPTTVRGDRVLLPPKRALVTYLHRTSDAFDLFATMQLRGFDRKAALNEYMRLIRERLPSCSTCHYNADQVFEVAKIIQLHAQKAAEANPSGADFEFILFGSFPNGRADTVLSDLDILAATDDQRIMMGRWYQDISSSIARVIPGSKLSLSFPTAGISPAQASTMSPVQIRITPSTIELQIYPVMGMSEWVYRTRGIVEKQINPTIYQ